MNWLYSSKGKALDIRFLESLVAVVDNGSISGAARAQGLTATAVSQRIRALEQEFGTKLLVRSGHSALPSKTCLNLLPQARGLIQQSAKLKRDFGSSVLSGPFRIGAIETALFQLIPAVVKNLSRDAPNCDLSVMPGTSIQLYQMLEKDQIDLAVIVTPPFVIPKIYHVEELASQPYVLIQGIQNGPVNQDDLMKQPIILYDRKSWGGLEAWKWLARHIDPKNILCELDAMGTIVAMVKSGLGISLLPNWSELMDDASTLSSIAPIPPIPKRQIILLCKNTEKNEPLFKMVRSAFLTL